MTLPIGQRYVLVDGPAIFNCDISTNPCERRHIATYVGDARQGTLCWDCAEAIYRLVAGERAKAARAARAVKLDNGPRVPSDGELRVEAVA